MEHEADGGQGPSRVCTSELEGPIRIHKKYIVCGRTRQYLTKARKLDTECFSSEPDVEARPVLRRLRSYSRVRGQCVGAFAECSSDIHLQL